MKSFSPPLSLKMLKLPPYCRERELWHIWSTREASLAKTPPQYPECRDRTPRVCPWNEMCMPVKFSSEAASGFLPDERVRDMDLTRESVKQSG